MKWPWSRRRSPAEQQPPHARPAPSRHPHDSLRLVKVAYARNQPEAEMIEGLLRQNGIESLTQRNGGFDVPDFLAAGARDVLVPETDAQRAHELLG